MNASHPLPRNSEVAHHRAGKHRAAPPLLVWNVRCIIAGIACAIAQQSIYAVRTFASPLASDSNVGAPLLSVYVAVGALLGTLLLQPLGLRFSRKAVVVGLAAINALALATAWLTLAPLPALGLVCLGIAGLAAGGAYLVFDQLQDQAPDGRKILTTNLVVGAWPIGLGMTVLAIPYISERLHDRVDLLLVLAAGVAAMVPVFVLVLSSDRREQPEQLTPSLWIEPLRRLREPRMLVLCGFPLASGFAIYAAESFVPMFASKEGPTVLCIAWIVGGGCAMLLGSLKDARPRLAFVAALAIQSLGCVIAALAPSTALLSVALVVGVGLSEVGSTVITGGTDIAKSEGDGRDGSRATAYNLVRLTGQLASAALAAEALPDLGSEQQLDYPQFLALMLLAAGVSALAALGALASRSAFGIADATRGDSHFHRRPPRTAVAPVKRGAHAWRHSHAGPDSSREPKASRSSQACSWRPPRARR